MITHPVLQVPDFKKTFVLTTDASDFVIRALLAQEGPEGQLLPQLYISKKLSPREMNWLDTEKECYAIIFAVEKLGPYLWGRKFVFQTNHSPLQWLKSSRDTKSKLFRWNLALQDYDFAVHHIPGKENKMADALSREWK